jgi:hypothetical protein
MASKPKHSTQDTARSKFAKIKANDVRPSGLIRLPVGQEDVFVIAIRKKECQEKK